MKRIVQDSVHCYGLSCIHYVTYSDGSQKKFYGNRVPASLRRFLNSSVVAEDAYCENGSSISLYVEGGE